MPVEAPSPLRGDLDLDHRPHGRRGLAGKVEDRPPAEQDPVLLQLLELPFDLGLRQAGDLGHLSRREAAAFNQ